MIIKLPVVHIDMLSKMIYGAADYFRQSIRVPPWLSQWLLFLFYYVNPWLLLRVIGFIYAKREGR